MVSSTSENDCIDRISTLPDQLLGKILSYLPIKEVVATSILSTRWKPLFPTHVPLTELDFDDSHTSRDTDFDISKRNFRNFVDKLLNVTLRNVLYVEKAAITCELEYSDDKILSWVCAALRLNVRHLHLKSSLTSSEALFDSLDGCTTLVELVVGNDFELCLPKEFVLPNVKKLSVYSLLLRDNIHELFDGCPVLNDLRIIGCDLDVLETLNIRSPILNKLVIDRCNNDIGCMVVIDCPSLEAFAYEGEALANYVLKDTGSLHSIRIEFDYFSEETRGNLRLVKLHKECSNTMRLCLIGNSVQALYRSSVPLPKFKNLTCLALSRMGRSGWDMLAKFLKCTPNLTMLTFEQGLGSPNTGFQSSQSNLLVCFELHLKKIEIWDFKWGTDEINLIEYFLKNGKVLQELIVHCLPHRNTSNLKKLFILPKYSKACQVLLKDGNNWGKSRYSCDTWF